MIDSDELLFTVDEHNNPIEPKTRLECHAKGYWHRTAHVWMINARQELLCQKRSLRKDSRPGSWEPFFGGHLAPREEYPDGAISEVNEELGLSLSANNLRLFKINLYRRPDGKNNEFQGIFGLKWDGEAAALRFEEEEIDQVAWRPLANVSNLLLIQKDPAWTFIGYEPEILPWLKTL